MNVTAMEHVHGATKRVIGIAHRNRRALRDALILIGLLRAAVYFFVQGIHPWTFVGIDARAYWRVDLAHPYASSGVGEFSTYLYSPAFAQFLSPLYVLPFEAFFVLWTAASVLVLYWLVRPWPWALLILLLPWTYELFVGQVHLFIAAAIVLGFRWPALWAFNILTKVTPGVGLLWFLVRREWRSLAIALGNDARHRGGLVPALADCVVRLVRVPAGKHRQRRAPVPADRRGSRHRGGRRADRPALGRPHRRVAGAAGGLDRVLGDPAGDHPVAGAGTPAGARAGADADARAAATMRPIATHSSGSQTRETAATTAPAATSSDTRPHARTGRAQHRRDGDREHRARVVIPGDRERGERCRRRPGEALDRVGSAPCGPDRDEECGHPDDHVQRSGEGVAGPGE